MFQASFAGLVLSRLDRPSSTLTGKHHFSRTGWAAQAASTLPMVKDILSFRWSFNLFPVLFFYLFKLLISSSNSGMVSVYLMYTSGFCSCSFSVVVCRQVFVLEAKWGPHIQDLAAGFPVLKTQFSSKWFHIPICTVSSLSVTVSRNSISLLRSERLSV